MQRTLINRGVWGWLFGGFRRVNRHHIELLKKTNRSLRRSLELDYTGGEVGVLPTSISASENEFTVSEVAVDEEPIVHEYRGSFNGLVLDGLHSSASPSFINRLDYNA